MQTAVLKSEREFVQDLVGMGRQKLWVVSAETSLKGRDGGIATHNNFIARRLIGISVGRLVVWIPHIPQRILDTHRAIDFAVLSILNLVAALQLLPRILFGRIAVEFPEYGGTFLLSAMIARWRECLVIVRVHGGRAFLRSTGEFGGDGAPAAPYLFEVQILHRAHMILFVSQFMADIYGRAIPCMPSALYLSRPGFNPIFLESVVPRLRGRTGVLFFGTCSEDKGFFDFCKVVEMADDVGNFEFRVAGRATRRALATMREHPQIRYLGPIDQGALLRELGKAIVAILPYRSEPFGLATVEAMAMGCIVIGCREGGTAEIVEHGVSGYTFSRDEFAEHALEIVRQLHQLEVGADSVEAMSDAARKRASEIMS